ncbi:acyltransferase [Mesorhizobium sp. XAP10]|uniref:acyltransferase family protein n=1 Tax=unclassified Mesorhizobium TaxID=325217 RepID=UPI0023DFAF48|nr:MULTISPECIES: acyltransferase [unclassified Mesorhizobium]MDF3154780.1 acyltransferase [Mesorhizobium sp. XAP10]MDF3247670.1 acyltransferase [Mesorhizobium sp. XAP4]
MEMRERLSGLDALRGMAALSIAVYHTVMLRELTIPAEIVPSFRFLYVAVSLFFAISAFSLCAGYHGKLASSAELPSFFLRRYLRIAPLFYLMIAVWVAIYSWLWGSWQIPAYDDVKLNALFLFNLVPEKNGSLVAAGWSLGVEMIFYALFPFLLYFLRDIRSALLGFLTSILVAVNAGIVFTPLANSYAWFSALAQLPFFVAGIVLFFVYGRCRSFSLRSRVTIALIGLLATPMLLAAFWYSGLLLVEIMGWKASAHLIGLGLLPLVLSFALYGLPALVNRATVFLGKISYGIYLIHPAVVVSVGMPLHKAMVDFPAWVTTPTIILTVVILSVCFATLTYYGLERPIMRMQGRKRTAARQGPMVALVESPVE